MEKGLPIFALVISAVLIARMPSKSEAAPVDELEFLSIDMMDLMDDGVIRATVTEITPTTQEPVNLNDQPCHNCSIKTPPHPTKPTHPTTKPTHPTKKTHPTTKPTHPTKKTHPTTKPTHPTKKTHPTTMPTYPTKKTHPTTRPTHPTKKTRPTTKPTHPTKKTRPTTPKPCPTKCPHKPCPPCQHDDDDVGPVADAVDFE